MRGMFSYIIKFKNDVDRSALKKKGRKLTRCIEVRVCLRLKYCVLKKNVSMGIS